MSRAPRQARRQWLLDCGGTRSLNYTSYQPTHRAPQPDLQPCVCDLPFPSHVSKNWLFLLLHRALDVVGGLMAPAARIPCECEVSEALDQGRSANVNGFLTF